MLLGPTVLLCQTYSGLILFRPGGRERHSGFSEEYTQQRTVVRANYTEISVAVGATHGATLSQEPSGLSIHIAQEPDRSLSVSRCT